MGCRVKGFRVRVKGLEFKDLSVWGFGIKG